MAPSQVNVEYFFRLLYNLLYGAHATALNYASSQAFTAYLWLWIIGIGYALSVLGLFVIVYVMMRLYEIRRREEEYYSTILPSSETAGGVNPRWQHIEELASGTSPSAWKEAIIEADIMLDDALAEAGYEGEGVAEKLKSIDPAQLGSLQDAWEAHKVRNHIAHQGSLFDLSEAVARRTILRFETVFRELRAI